MTTKNILITGGLGFIGSYLIKKLLSSTEDYIFNFDFKGYASDSRDIEELIKLNPTLKKRYQFNKVDLNDYKTLKDAINTIQPDLIFHLAAESHVDRSIDMPLNFLKSNVIGTFNICEVIRSYFTNLSSSKKNKFKLLHISTDEVFGSLNSKGSFNEFSRYDPSSPYSATKASSDHFVRAWQKTYGIPSIICNCSNNFGPWQFPEKLIPNVVLKALKNEKIPIYGNGLNIRDWIYVEDHVNALCKISQKGEPGDTYCIGGNNEKSNLEIAQLICDILDELIPSSKIRRELINFVNDRPGHDKRYSVDNNKIINKIGWQPTYHFEESLRNTTEWYLKNINWCERILLKANYGGERLGNLEKI